MELEPDLAAFLARHWPLGVGQAAWLNGALQLRVTDYLADASPPIEFVNSVRGIVFQSDAVLVVRGLLEADALHIVPGGRREHDETLEQTLRREVLEETGWTLKHAALLGFSHFHILDRPPEYRLAHSGFLNVVFIADAGAYHPAARLPGDVEVGVGFWPLADVLALPLSPSEQRLLRAALVRRAERSEP
jgi:ADP-ribose pyrophosphatase YjhB (NUDIX family)